MLLTSIDNFHLFGQQGKIGIPPHPTIEVGDIRLEQDSTLYKVIYFFAWEPVTQHDEVFLNDLSGLIVEYDTRADCLVFSLLFPKIEASHGLSCRAERDYVSPRPAHPSGLFPERCSGILSTAFSPLLWHVLCFCCHSGVWDSPYTDTGDTAPARRWRCIGVSTWYTQGY